MSDMITIFVEGGEYVDKATFIRQRGEIERLQYEIEKLRFVIELMPCTCRGVETCLRCEALEASDEVS